MNDIKFSLIIATLNREKEIDEFLISIEKNIYNLDQVEIIIVDQNDKINLENIIKKNEKKMNITHIKSKEKGLSKNRNIGIKKSTGEIIAFPDDDCKYLENTLKKVEELFEQNKEMEILMGRIVDEQGKDCLKKWSRKEEIINEKNFVNKISSITIFMKNKGILFDEKLGVGGIFPSAEDADYIFQNMKRCKKAFYSPEIIVFHPKATKDNFNYKKAYEYGLGFGAFCRKNLNLYFLKFFILGNIWALIRMSFFLITFRLVESKIWFYSMKGRIKGFFKYNKKREEA